MQERAHRWKPRAMQRCMLRRPRLAALSLLHRRRLSAPRRRHHLDRLDLWARAERLPMRRSRCRLVLPRRRREEGPLLAMDLRGRRSRQLPRRRRKEDSWTSSRTP
eukprot:Amastigsp_a340141_25.p6 type:complete len:106 gc:universal Amastigsp_a340141_25:261-578(+)